MAHLPKNVTRRDLLRFTMAGAGIAALGPLARMSLPLAAGAPLPNHKRLVIINCYGGYDGLNMIVPVTNNAYYSERPDINIAAANALPLNGTGDYATHPNLDGFASLYNAGDGAIFRKVGYPTANLSHFTSQDIYSRGVRGEFEPLPIAESGWLARVADLAAPTPMGTVTIGVGRPVDVEGGSSTSFMANRLEQFDFRADYDYYQNYLLRLEVIKELLEDYTGDTLSTEAATALDQSHTLASQIQDAVTQYNSPHDALYPDSAPGIWLRDIARLIQYGFETKVFYTGFGGWDTHGDQGSETGTQADLIKRLDDALKVFSDDMKYMNVWDDTLVLIITEFGRRNFDNDSLGTDHGHGNTLMAAGGPVIQGLYGPELSEPDIADQPWLDYNVDFRDIYKEALTRHVGVDAAAVFPEPQDINTTLNYLPGS